MQNKTEDVYGRCPATAVALSPIPFVCCLQSFQLFHGICILVLVVRNYWIHAEICVIKIVPLQCWLMPWLALFEYIVIFFLIKNFCLELVSIDCSILYIVLPLLLKKIHMRYIYSFIENLLEYCNVKRTVSWGGSSSFSEISFLYVVGTAW